MLELDGLVRHFDDTIALDRLSFTVPRGQVFGFLGPNGAGKSTAMRAVMRLTALDAGQVRWDGATYDLDTCRGFGYMPEERGLYPTMRVAEHLQYLARLHGLTTAAARQRAAEWLARLGLSERAQDKVEALSLGNQQRVQLAAALVHEPQLLVLDEPFSGLDPVGVDELAGVLRERARAGAAVLFSSHQLDLVEQLCESVAIVHRGRCVASGTVRELGRTGARRVEVEVTGDPDARWAAALHGVRVLGTEHGRARLVLGDGVDPQQVLAAAIAAGPVEHFAVCSRRLSEVFREAVGRPLEDVQGGVPR
ncbi:ATP-binding cassette domain-containing protein [Jatrophihabitans cynanchi]|uniref:ATP-binding cassette domain-containing protein n=1 Tax=Jatrophihabitans cynanchi TaxID=2944128 RepID=A0ABY7JZ76_9ACTN|nr:ATP-binding cassette domain-containing protein [Jatrophihabitans sp. SB3-54]WAX57881.1 ATP-binding cassette domain-containing protein [Jatrophihabitans sp. SB3-54]